MMNPRSALILSLAIALAPGALAQAPDPVKGEAIFKRCLACHRIETPTNLVGPHLQAIVGRPAASIEGYSYSPAMLAKAKEGLVWTEDSLAAYLTDPKTVVPGGKMAFPGIKKPDELADLIAYLKAH
jgi:cytochrome c